MCYQGSASTKHAKHMRSDIFSAFKHFPSTNTGIGTLKNTNDVNDNSQKTFSDFSKRVMETRQAYQLDIYRHISHSNEISSLKHSLKASTVAGSSLSSPSESGANNQRISDNNNNAANDKDVYLLLASRSAITNDGDCLCVIIQTFEQLNLGFTRATTSNQISIPHHSVRVQVKCF